MSVACTSVFVTVIGFLAESVFLEVKVDNLPPGIEMKELLRRHELVIQSDRVMRAASRSVSWAGVRREGLDSEAGRADFLRRSISITLRPESGSLTVICVSGSPRDVPAAVYLAYREEMERKRAHLKSQQRSLLESAAAATSILPILQRVGSPFEQENARRALRRITKSVGQVGAELWECDALTLRQETTLPRLGNAKE